MSALVAVDRTQGRPWEGEVNIAPEWPRAPDFKNSSSLLAQLWAQAILAAMGHPNDAVVSQEWLVEDGEVVLTFLSRDDLGCLHAHIAVPL